MSEGDRRRKGSSSEMIIMSPETGDYFKTKK